jgi:homoserine dehydrogenase
VRKVSVSESEQATAEQPLKVALLGCGVVGSSVARMLTQHADDLAARIGRPLELIGIAVRRAGKDRSDLPVDPADRDADQLQASAHAGRELVGVRRQQPGDRRPHHTAAEHRDAQRRTRFVSRWHKLSFVVLARRRA